MKTDKLIQEAVILELKQEPSIDSSKIGVSVTDGIVTLNGYVDSYVEKLTAEQIASRVIGVKAIAEEIEVKLPQYYERNDADIAEAAANALEWNVSVPHNRIKVKVQDGWVTLNGEVDWEYQKYATRSSVCCLLGVKGITNQITVKFSLNSVDVKNKN